jgi:hypothetical protein
MMMMILVKGPLLVHLCCLLCGRPRAVFQRSERLGLQDA